MGSLFWSPNPYPKQDISQTWISNLFLWYVCESPQPCLKLFIIRLRSYLEFLYSEYRLFRHSWVSWPLAVLLQGAEIDEVSMRSVKLLSGQIHRIYEPYSFTTNIPPLVDFGIGTQLSPSLHTMLLLPRPLHHHQEQIVSNWKSGMKKIKIKLSLNFQ